MFFPFNVLSQENKVEPKNDKTHTLTKHIGCYQ